MMPKGNTNIIVRKTYEINDGQWRKFVKEFNNTFNRQSSVEDKKEFYSSNVYGYSYHAFAVSDNGNIIGHTSLIPSQYRAGDQTVMMGISGGTFVSKEHRSNIFLFREMYNKLKKYAQKEGMTATLGVPNKNSFQYVTKILNKVHIGDLNYYVLPVRLGNIMDLKFKSICNFLSRLAILAWYWINKLYILFHNPKDEKPIYEVIKSTDFLNKRFKKGYGQVADDTCGQYYYKLEDEGGIRVAYIMYANGKSGADLKSLLRISNIILGQEMVDMVMYIGLLNFFPRFLFKVPKSKIPQKLPLTVDVLNPDIIAESIFEIRNWKYSLIDFDVR